MSGPHEDDARAVYDAILGGGDDGSVTAMTPAKQQQPHESCRTPIEVGACHSTNDVMSATAIDLLLSTLIVIGSAYCAYVWWCRVARTPSDPETTTHR